MLKVLFFFLFSFQVVFAAAQADYVYISGRDTLHGTLQLPALQGKVPVVLIIAGSGPTDRDGNSRLGVRCNAYRMLADSLQRDGIATLRYDKRGIGASAGAMKSESEIRFEDMIRDAAGFALQLKKDGRFSKVIILGHSEGSLVGMVAARDARADGFISLAGAGDRIDRIIESQLKTQLPQLVEQARSLFDSLGQGFTVQEPKNYLASLFHKSVQPYIMSWMKYDPQAEIKKLSFPVLILQGTTDIQVSVEDARKLKAAKPDATLQIITGMNHILKPAPADSKQNIATYTQPELGLHPALTAIIRDFVK